MILDGRKINTEKFSEHLREKGVLPSQKKILMTKFPHSEQEKDLTLPANCEGFGRIHHFRRSIDNVFQSNPLPIDPALNYLKLPLTNEIKVQVFQNAFCSWRCWYCFVDYNLLSANEKYAEFKTVDELLDLYLNSEYQSPIIDLSGGQPDLVPEWSLWMADRLKKLNLTSKVYLWSDDNLSNDYLWRYLKKSEIKRLASYKNYGRVGCFKGFDEESFSFNTTAQPNLWTEQFRIMRRLVDANLDMYGYVTLTSNNDQHIEKKIIRFMDIIQEVIHPLFPLRTIPLKIYEYSPTKHRMTDVHKLSLLIQEQAAFYWNQELAKRFTNEQRAKRVYEHIIST